MMWISITASIHAGSTITQHYTIAKVDDAEEADMLMGKLAAELGNNFSWSEL